MRRSKKHESEQYGGLAGWLFADIALVLALAFLSSKVIGKSPAEAARTTTTTTTPLPPGVSRPASAVNVKEIELDEVCIANPKSFNDARRRIEAQLATKKVPPNTRFGVMLIYAGYDGTVSDEDLKVVQDDARQLARDLRDTMQSWPSLNSERWIRDLGHDGGTSPGCYKIYLLRQLSND
jgi:hypothetical protein